jgi:hypothetical protein
MALPCLSATLLTLAACGGGGGGGGGTTPTASNALAASQYTVYKTGPVATLQGSAVLTSAGSVSGVTATNAAVSLGADGSSTLTLTSGAATTAAFSATTTAGGAVTLWSARNGGVLMLCDGTAGIGGTPTTHYVGLATASSDAAGTATAITSATGLAGKSFRAVHDCVADSVPTMSFDSTGARVEPDPVVPGTVTMINQLLGSTGYTVSLNDPVTGNLLGSTVYSLKAYQFMVGGVVKVYLVEQVNSDLTGSPAVTLRLLTSE